MSLDKGKFTDKNQDTEVKDNQEAKFKEELELISLWWKNEEILNKYLTTYHNIDLNSFDSDTKKRFLEELNIIFSEFKNFKFDMSKNLKKIREDMSSGFEEWKSYDYYKSLIISNKIQKRIIILSESIKIITWDKIKIWNKDYNKETYSDLKNNISNLDKTYNLDIFSKIEKNLSLSTNVNLGSLFYQELSDKIANPQPDLSYQDTISWLSSIWYKWRSEKLTNVKLKNWETINLVELYEEYNKNYKIFQSKSEVFYWGNKQLKYTKKWFGFNDWYWVTYEKLEEIYAEKLADIENMWISDMVILLRVLLWAVIGPLWWYDDLKQASSWINFDGSIQWLWENMFMYLTWSLWISIVWWSVASMAKWPRLARALIKIEQITKRLTNSKNLEKLSKNKKFIDLLKSLKWKIPWIDNLLLKLSKTTEIKLTNEIITKLTDEELIIYILENNIEKLDISLLSWKELARINHLITNNFPLLEISRLIPWDRLININFSWIKQINDIAGTDFCDKVILKFKDILKSQFTKSHGQSEHKWRIIKNDYKNITFETNSNNPLKAIFWETTSKQEIVDYILTSMDRDIEKNARTLLKNQIDKWELIITSQKQFEELVIQKVSQTKLVVLRYFDFWVWESVIPKNAQDIEKLDAIRKAEISSRASIIKQDKIILKEYNTEEIISNLEKAIYMEKSVIEKFRWKKFNFEWINYNVVFENNWNLSLSTELLRYVRKYPEKVKPEELANMVKSYINNLNLSLDFISPVKQELKNWWSEFQNARNIDKEIKSWVIDTKHLTQSYKWWLTKSAFFDQTSNKDWIKVFIDIKDMWIDNLVDFNLRAKQILKLQKDLKSWKIDLKTFEEKQAKIFLEAWKSVSDKFIEIQKRITQKYKDAVMSFGWDEIYLFIPDKKTKTSEEIQSNLTNIFNSTNQKARIVIDSTTKTTNSKENYAKLEKITKLNKILEETIEKQLTKKWITLNWNIPENTYIKINDFVREKLMSDSFNIDDFFKEIKIMIEKQNLIWNWKNDTLLWVTKSWIKVNLKKRPNNEIEIYLNN